MWNHCFCVFSLLKLKFQFAYSKCWAWPTWILVPMKKKIKLKCRVVCVCVSVFDVIRIIRSTSISSLADYLSKSVICLFFGSNSNFVGDSRKSHSFVWARKDLKNKIWFQTWKNVRSKLFVYFLLYRSRNSAIEKTLKSYSVDCCISELLLFTSCKEGKCKEWNKIHSITHQEKKKKLEKDFQKNIQRNFILMPVWFIIVPDKHQIYTIY